MTAQLLRKTSFSFSVLVPNVLQKDEFTRFGQAVTAGPASCGRGGELPGGKRNWSLFGHRPIPEPVDSGQRSREHGHLQGGRGNGGGSSSQKEGGMRQKRNRLREGGEQNVSRQGRQISVRQAWLNPVGDPGPGWGDVGRSVLLRFLGVWCWFGLTWAEFPLLLHIETSTASTQASWVASVLSSAFYSSAREPLARATGRCCPVTRDPILSAIATGADHFHRLSQSSPVFRAALGEGGRGAGAPVDRTLACAPPDRAVLS